VDGTELEIKSTGQLVFLPPSEILSRVILSSETTRYGQRLLEEEKPEE
jgi:hypothetical protein